MSGAARLAPSAVSGQGRIPVLDIGPFLAGEPDAAAPLARAVARACEDTGFLVVANHRADSSGCRNTMTKEVRDDHSKAAIGSICQGAIAVPRATASGRTRRAATVLGSHRGRHGE